MIPTAHPSPQPKRHLDRFSRFCTDDRRVALYFTMGRPFPHQNCPFPWGSGSPSNTWFLGLTRVLNPNVIPSLYFTTGCHFPLEIACSRGGISTSPNTWFLGPIPVHTQTIGSAISAGLIIMTDRPTVTTCHIYVVLQYGQIIIMIIRSVVISVLLGQAGF